MLRATRWTVDRPDSIRIPADKRNVTEPDERRYELLMVLEFASQTATVLLT